MFIPTKCSKCKEYKSITSFRKSSDKKLGHEYSCKECKSKVEKKWRDNNREKIRETQRRHYKKNRERIIQNRKDNYDPIKARARWIAKKIEQEKCIFCDNIGERHHKDYNHPLDIVFLCKSHHKMIHDGTIKL